MDLIRPCIKCGNADRTKSRNCRPCQVSYNAHYKANNKQKIAVVTATYKAKNRSKIAAANTAYQRKRYRTNIQHRLTVVIRSRLCGSIKTEAKRGSSIVALGCSVAHLKVHLERQFQPGMTWDNWSLHGWHIDHIIPLAAFDLTDKDQFLKACHYTNLRPLWATDNLAKGSKYGN